MDKNDEREHRLKSREFVPYHEFNRNLKEIIDYIMILDSIFFYTQIFQQGMEQKEIAYTTFSNSFLGSKNS